MNVEGISSIIPVGSMVFTMGEFPEDKKFPGEQVLLIVKDAIDKQDWGEPPIVEEKFVAVEEGVCFIGIMLLHARNTGNIYESFINYYEPGGRVKRVVELLAKQEMLFIFLTDENNRVLRKMAFGNSYLEGIEAFLPLIQKYKPWKDTNFNAAKKLIQGKHSVEELFNLMEHS